MNKLQPLLDLINQLIISKIQVEATASTASTVEVRAIVESLLLKTPAAEGLVLEDIRCGLERVQFPSLQDPNLIVVLVLEKIDIQIAPAFWARAARLAPQAPVAKLGILLDRVEVRDLRLEVQLPPSRWANVHLTLGSLAIKVVGRPILELSQLQLDILELNLQEKDRRKALNQAQIRLQDLRLRLLELLLNRALEVGQDRIPPIAKISSLDISLSDDTLRLSVKTGWWFTTIGLEIRPSTRNNRLGIAMVMPYPVRKLILGAVHKAVANKPGIEVLDDTIWIDVLSRLPLQLQCRIERFGVEQGAIVLQFGQVPWEARSPVLALPAATLDSATLDSSTLEVGASQE